MNRSTDVRNFDDLSAEELRRLIQEAGNALRRGTEAMNDFADTLQRCTRHLEQPSGIHVTQTDGSPTDRIAILFSEQTTTGIDATLRAVTPWLGVSDAELSRASERIEAYLSWPPSKYSPMVVTDRSNPSSRNLAYFFTKVSVGSVPVKIYQLHLEAFRAATNHSTLSPSFGLLTITKTTLDETMKAHVFSARRDSNIRSKDPEPDSGIDL